MAGTEFAKMVPGFDFLQGRMQNAGAGLPSMSQWIAPTLNPEEIGKRIEELRTVQFWLEQNARLLGATIQALEVQRMTLATLQTMNLPMTELRESMKITPPAPPAPAAPEARNPEPVAAPKPAATKKAAAGEDKAAAGGVDPMQWWGALTKQFTDLAANALKEGGPARQLADAMVEAPAETLAKVMPAPAKSTRTPAKTRRPRG